MAFPVPFASKVKCCLQNAGRVGVLSAKKERPFYTSTVCCAVRVEETKKDNVLVIEGVQIPKFRPEQMVKLDKPEGSCTLCGLDVRYTDVLILQQFVDKSGQVYPREVTGLCDFKHKKMQKLVYMAKHTGLMKDPPLLDGSINKKPKSWQDFSSYYDDDYQGFL